MNAIGARDEKRAAAPEGAAAPSGAAASRGAAIPCAPAAAPGREAGLGLARSVMARYPRADVSWHYEHGLFLGAARAAARAWDDPGLDAAARERIASLVGAGGEIRGYRVDEFNLDQVNPGRNLFALLDETGDRRYAAAISTLSRQLASHPRGKSGGYWHKKVYPEQMWLDGLYMAQPFKTLAALRDGDASALEDVVRQFALMESKARDPRTGLLYHAWDESRAQLWANPETGCSPHFWGRAIGWFAMALVDVIEYLPLAFAGRARLGEIMGRLAEAVAPYQDASTGLWYQVVDQAGREGNYPEASVSSMLSYALAKAARLGASDPGPARASAAKAHEGACARFLAQDGSGGLRLEGTCSVAGLGGKPYRDGSYAYYVREPVKTDDFKGVGPFILAAIEYENGRDSGSR